jgi:two-component sensor histidine kinase/putative methionine-R-sulfoxide reductase with GAF domain
MPRRERISRLKKVLRQQEALAKFGGRALQEEDLTKILTDAAELCATGLGVRYGKVLRYRAPSGDLIVEAGFGWRENVIGKSIARADDSSPAGKAYRTRKPIITPDVSKTHGASLPSIYPDHGVISCVNVLICDSGDEPYGVLEADSDKPRKFDRYDIHFLTGFANILADAVTTTRTLEKLRSTIAERDILSRELQHRVRNNLQLVWQLLNTQAATIQDATAKRGIIDVAGRVIALGQVYDHLVGREMSHAADCGEYLKSLCTRIREVRHAVNSHVELVCQADALSLDIDRTTTVGLIVNELITNSYDHAFPGGKGRIRVILRHPPAAKNATLIVADNGVGAILGQPNRENPRLGVGLVRRLAGQIGGRLNFEVKQGTRWEIEFAVKAVNS